MIKAVGTNTATKTKAVAIIGPTTSLIAFRVASLADSPKPIWRSTFSTTTIASSTTIPIAKTKPNNDKVFKDRPMADITAKVPIKDTGTANKGMIVARQFCKKITTTNTTNNKASNKVTTTALIDC